jgi:hypothetical protein
MRERTRPVELHCVSHTGKLAAGSDSFARPIRLIRKADHVHFDLHTGEADRRWNAARQRNAGEDQTAPSPPPKNNQSETAAGSGTQPEDQT